MAALRRLIAPLAACVCVAGAAAAQEPCAQQLTVSPAQIPITLWYGGASVHVHADVPAHARLALIWEGPRGKVELHKKGKVGGLLWMNVGDVKLDDVPSAYWVSTTGPLPGLGTKEQRASQEVGYEALAAAVKGDVDAFPELVKLKEEEGLFGMREGGLKPRAGNSADVLEQDIPISARMQEGRYVVRLVEFGDAGARCLGTADVDIAQVGMTKSLRALAFQHGLMYGIAAVVIAIAAGLATGLVFGKGASKGH